MQAAVVAAADNASEPTTYAIENGRYQKVERRTGPEAQATKGTKEPVSHLDDNTDKTDNEATGVRHRRQT
jgi:hypothetical protein